uniref:PIN-like domain-containing protein n=1 Tax=Psychrobacter sp. TaxID=56811 RepID=UPI0015993883|nr:PIN-like domain-containing protein [Psychrobacter sp.]QJS05763.1 hypothetical protein [Psychrobacter sp.]
MREKFKVFYEPTEEESSKIWADSQTIFILDTNILLNFYRYSQETQDEFFKIFKLIEDRIWIPFHVALEYQRIRLEVIKDEKEMFDRIEAKLKTIKTSVSNSFSEFKLKTRNPNLFNMEEKFKEEVCSLIDRFKAEVNDAGKAQPSVRTHDEIRAKLDALLEGKIGDEPEEKWVTDVAEDGATRYENKVPPGYKDESKGNEGSKAVFTYNNIEYERRFGDLIIWKQILEHLRELEGIKNVIFITDDIKEDWWEIVQCDGAKHIGARTELKSEMYKETGIDSFKMYHSDDFLAAAENYCGISINDKALEETKHVFDSWNTYLNETKKYKIDSDAVIEWQNFFSNIEKYKTDNDTASKLQGILSTVENYKTDNDTASKLQGIWSIIEKYKTDNDTASKLQGILNSINNLDNLDNLDDE